MIAGQTFGVHDDDPGHRFHAETLVDLIEGAGHTWAAYEESIPSAGFLGDYWPSSEAPLYASKHNPFVFFDGLLATIEQGWNLGHLGHAGDVAGGVVPMDDLLGR